MIVQFRPRNTKSRSRNRVEAMMKGEIETYTCNDCGKDFEVLFENFPEKCPHCDRLIDWESSEK